MLGAEAADDLAALAEAIRLPLNVLVVPALLPELGRLTVGCVSTGSLLYRAAAAAVDAAVRDGHSTPPPLPMRCCTSA